MRVATWNINSVRIRLGVIKSFVDQYQPDILCLQEIKTEAENFPHAALDNMGFKHRLVRGEKSYNGVAILSKVPLEISDQLTFVNGQARHISARISNGMELHNFYVPAGGDIADPEINSKFDMKLKYMEEVANWFQHNRKASDRIILLGDINVAPGKYDVWSHRQLLDIVSHTYMEKYYFRKILNSLNFIDAVREFVPHHEKLYSWWSYRNKDWKLSNKGRRLDHILITEPLKPYLTNYDIFKSGRDLASTSDHVPVIIDLQR